MTKYYSVIGCGFGDEGKGTIVDYLCSEHTGKNVLIVRPNGGCQSAHHVVNPDGTFFRFSQVGAGYFRCQNDTYLDKNFIVNFDSLYEEVTNPIFSKPPKVYLHNKCLVSTDFHIMENRIASEGLNNTCGFGIGSTREYWLKYGNDAIFAQDLVSGLWEGKIELLRQRMCYKHPKYAERFRLISSFKPSPFFECADYIPSYKYDILIFEHSQGVLLDEYLGVGAPDYCTWSDTTDRHTKDLCKLNNINYKDVRKIGVLRTYFTRHGDGPFDEDKNMSSSYKEKHNCENPSQGRFRCGQHKQELIDRALSCVTIDEIAWTHVDVHPIPDVSIEVPNFIRSYGPTYKDKKEINV